MSNDPQKDTVSSIEEATSASNVTDAEKVLELKERIKLLVEHYSIDRGKLAEQVGFLLEENDRLKKHIEMLEVSSGQHVNIVHHPTEFEKELGLDFSV